MSANIESAITAQWAASSITFQFLLRAECIRDRHYLIFPRLMAQRRPVQLLAIELPQRHKPVHIRNKALVVVALQQVNHLMDNNVLQTMNRLLDKLDIQPDA